MRRTSTILTICTLIFMGGLVRADDAKPAAKATRAKAPAHIMLAPEDIKWGAAPPVFPAGATKFAVLSGDPGKPGLFTIRLKMPDGYQIPAHWHPTNEYVTVLSGTLYMGSGDKLEESKGRAMGAGSYGVVPAKSHHFVWAKGDTEIQVSAMGPFAMTYIDPANDPMKNGAGAAAEKK
jgi:hypothetical protein